MITLLNITLLIDLIVVLLAIVFYVYVYHPRVINKTRYIEITEYRKLLDSYKSYLARFNIKHESIESFMDDQITFINNKLNTRHWKVIQSPRELARL